MASVGSWLLIRSADGAETENVQTVQHNALFNHKCVSMFSVWVSMDFRMFSRGFQNLVALINCHIIMMNEVTQALSMTPLLCYSHL